MTDPAWAVCNIGSCRRHQQCMYTPCRSQPDEPVQDEDDGPKPHPLDAVLTNDTPNVVIDEEGFEVARFRYYTDAEQFVADINGKHPCAEYSIQERGIHVGDTEGDGAGGEAAIAIAEHAFKAGYMARPCLDEEGTGAERAWGEYEPPEHIKALA